MGKVSKEARKRYDEKTKRFVVRYSLSEMEIADALTDYLEETGQSVNGYLKSLIKKDLTEKGIIDNYSE